MHDIDRRRRVGFPQVRKGMARIKLVLTERATRENKGDPLMLHVAKARINQL